MLQIAGLVNINAWCRTLLKHDNLCRACLFFYYCKPAHPYVLQLAFVGMTSESYDQIRVWLQYHQSLGVSIFYLFVDGQAARADVQAQLALLPGVTVIPRNEELIERQAHSRIWNETWLAAFFHKPCNHELFVRQSLNMESKSAFADCASAAKSCWHTLYLHRPFSC